MKGLNVSTSLSRSPEIAKYLTLYEQCRSMQLIQTEGQKGTGKNTVRTLKITAFPTGFTFLPDEGGLLDQEYKLSVYFEIFFATERNMAFRNLGS